MSFTAVRPAARSSSLDIPLRLTVNQFPFWHRDELVVAVARLDPEYAELRRHFPDTWRHLVRVKTLFDSMSALDVPQAVRSEEQYREQVSPLLHTAARLLLLFAEEEKGATTGAAVAHTRAAAERLSHYADTGSWTLLTLFEPQPGEPWLYCGPIGTWAVRDARSPLSLLVAVPCASLQAEVDTVSGRIDELRTEAAHVLGGDIKSIQQIHPTMQVTDLLLAGGETVSGHKNFAHFFPLEAVASTVEGPEFTVIFANVHRERLRRCSLELLKEVWETGAEARLDEVLRMSLRWFRCHDLGHFWRRTSVPGQGTAAAGLSQFERSSLEEAYADTLGLLSAEALGQHSALDAAFAAEMIRYLSRRYSQFADSTAAILTLGWLRWYAATADFPTTGVFLKEARPALEDLARTLHRVLWDAESADVGKLRAAVARGLEYCESLSGSFRSLPTDLSYTFG